MYLVPGEVAIQDLKCKIANRLLETMMSEEIGFEVLESIQGSSLRVPLSQTLPLIRSISIENKLSLIINLDKFKTTLRVE